MITLEFRKGDNTVVYQREDDPQYKVGDAVSFFGGENPTLEKVDSTHYRYIGVKAVMSGIVAEIETLNNRQVIILK